MVFRKVDNATHGINRYPLYKCPQTDKPRYPMDNDLSGGKRYSVSTFWTTRAWILDSYLNQFHSKL